ncbi:MAG: CarD family transcriptional regulator [Bacillota bacterium]
MFKIGDKVVYPMHGAGIIEDVEIKEILNEEKKYFVLNLPLKEMRVMIPADNTEDLGLRHVVDEEKLNEVFDVLVSGLSKMDKNWNRRFRKNSDKLKTGDILEVAEVVRNLMIMDDKKGLSTGERKMVNNSKKFLLSEICLVKDIEMEEAEEIVKQKVGVSIDLEKEKVRKEEEEEKEKEKEKEEEN